MSPKGGGMIVLQNGMPTSIFFWSENLPFFEKEIGKLIFFPSINLTNFANFWLIFDKISI
jgi:hypothetical protein